jgi:F0F1-type ATP synthase membrane subunit c/vacuolar-type H+-ATPase subunit K
MIYIALCLCFICMAAMGYCLSRLGDSYFSSVSRNPTIANSVGTNLLVLIATIEIGMIILVVFGFMLILKLA